MTWKNSRTHAHKKPEHKPAGSRPPPPSSEEAGHDAKHGLVLTAAAGATRNSFN